MASPSARSGDRFIPSRSAIDLSVSHFELTHDSQNCAENAGVNASPAKEEYKKVLAANLFTGRPANKILTFSNKAPRPAEAEDHHRALRVLYSQNRKAGLVPYARHTPQVPEHAERILDLPGMLDDFYLNLLDWGKNNVLSVALGGTVYLWNASGGSIQKLMQTTGSGSHVTSLSWMQEDDTNTLAVGTSDHKVLLWDADKLKQVHSMNGHHGQVASLAWNNHLLSSGGHDSQIIHHDVRVADGDHKVGVLKGHTAQVCGLKWSPQGTMLASGGNDNLLNIWDNRYVSTYSHTTDQPLFRLDAHKVCAHASAYHMLLPYACDSLTSLSLCHGAHQAAVKAIAWCPWQRNLLASGGGTADRTAV